MQALYDAYRPVLLRRFRGKGFSVSDAEDMLHELFLKLVHAAAQFGAERGCVSAWVHVSAYNIMVDRWRLRGREMPNASPDMHAGEDAGQDGAPALPGGRPLFAPDDGAAARDVAVRRCVHARLRAFARHHPAVADAIHLSALESWSIEALAQFIDRTAGATREYLSQGRKKLRPYLKPCLEHLAD